MSKRVIEVKRVGGMPEYFRELFVSEQGFRYAAQMESQDPDVWVWYTVDNKEWEPCCPVSEVEFKVVEEFSEEHE